MINIFDQNFIHTEKSLGYITCSDTRKPTKGVWQNGLTNPDTEISVFTDFYCGSDLIIKNKSKYKLFWLVEPKDIHGWAYEWIVNNQDLFDGVITYDVQFAKHLKNPILSRFGSSRIYEYVDSPKKKLLSIIASNKNMTEGHQLRHDICRALGNKYQIDMWGSGYRSFDSKLDPLKDYCFSICIQNCKIDQYYTEILIDAFRTKTIPIFWGCPSIGKDFDIDGILPFNSIYHLEEILESLSFDMYNSKIKNIENNYTISEKYLSTDDLIFEEIENWKAGLV